MWLSKLYAYSVTSAPKLQHSYLATMAVHLSLSMQKMGALSTDCSRNVFLQFMQFGPYELVFHELHDSDSSLVSSIAALPVLSARAIILFSELHNSWLGAAAARFFRSVKKWDAWNTGLSSSIGFQLIHFEPLLIPLARICQQWLLNCDEHSGVCITSWHEKLQGEIPGELYDTPLPMEMDPMDSTAAWEHCYCQHLISVRSSHLLLGYIFEQRISCEWEDLFYSNQQTSLAYLGMVDFNTTRMCILTMLGDDSVHDCVVPICAIIQSGGDQCKCEWSPQCLLSKGMEEVRSSQNNESCVPVDTSNQQDMFSYEQFDWAMNIMSIRCYAWRLLNSNFWQANMGSCFNGYSCHNGFLLLPWGISWTVKLEFSSSGNKFEQPFLPPTVRSAESTWKQATQGGRLALTPSAFHEHAHGGRAQAMGGMVFSTSSDQEPFQGGRGGIGFIITVRFAQGSIDQTYYLGFNQEPADIDYLLGISLDQVPLNNNYCFCLVEVYPGFVYHRDFDQVQEHQAQWDPGGRRLGVKPSFKEGGMLGASPSQYMGLTPEPAHGPGPSRSHRATTNNPGVGNEEGIQWITNGNGGGSCLSFPYLQFIPCSSFSITCIQSCSSNWCS